MAVMSLVKWAGGKGWLVDDHVVHLPEPEADGSYHEPFLGSAAVARHYLGRTTCFLSDKNKRLIAVYEGVRDNPEEVHRALKTLVGAHSEEAYYRVRKRFNEDEGKNPVLRAARLIYLNRACYKGLYRESKAGVFNVPWGFYSAPGLPTLEDLVAWAALLKPASGSVRLFSSSFLDALDQHVTARSVVFLDPPYVPMTKSANFTQYEAEGFGPKDQEALAEMLIELDVRGAKFLLTNNVTARKLYERWDVLEVEVSRSMSDGSKKRRGKVKEILVANYSISEG